MMKLTKWMLAGAAVAIIPLAAVALEPFRHTITGDVLDIETAPKEGRDLEAVKQFLATGVNP